MATVAAICIVAAGFTWWRSNTTTVRTEAVQAPIAVLVTGRNDPGDEFNAFLCGAWQLGDGRFATAGHCVTDGPLSIVVDDDLCDGKAARWRSEVVDAERLGYDGAILSVARDGEIPRSRVEVPRGADVVVGWGSVDDLGGPLCSAVAREVEVVADEPCDEATTAAFAATGPPAGVSEVAARCATLSTAACSGASGSALLVADGPRLRFDSVLSWTDGCAPGHIGGFQEIEADGSVPTSPAEEDEGVS